MKYDMKKINRIFSLGLAGMTLSTPAMAQVLDQAWSFSNQNRASIAALIKSVEDGQSSSGSSNVTQGDGGTTLVCGGGSEASAATGNSSCIILNNSDGTIQLGQDSDGNQTASNDINDTVTVEEHINGADDILETLQGE